MFCEAFRVESPRTRQWRRWAAPLAVLLGLAATTVVYQSVDSATNTAREIEFERRTDLVGRAIGRELLRHVEILQGLASLHTASEEVSRDEFSVYTEHALGRKSIQAFEWIPRVSAAERASFEARAKADWKGEFAIRRFTESGWIAEEEDWAEEYFPVHYVEPSSGNGRAVGIDLGSQVSRRVALERARDTGEPVATARIELVQEDEPSPAFLVFVPVYERGPSPQTKAERRAALKGFSVGVFRVSGIVEAALGELHPRDIAVEIEGLAYRGEAPVAELDEPTSELSRTLDVKLAGRSWMVDCTALESLSIGLEWRKWVVLLGGAVASLLLGGLVLAGVARMERVERLVERRTAELESTTGQLREMFDGAFDAIVVVGVDGRVRRWNRAAERIFGWTAEHAIGELLEELVVPLRYREAHREGLANLARTGQPNVDGRTLELQALRRFGGEFPVELTVSTTGTEDEMLFTAIVRDTSERMADRRRLENVSRQLEHILDAIEEGVYGVDVDGRTTFVNRSAARMLGRDASMLPGRRAEDILTKGGEEDERDEVLASCETGLSHHGDDAEFVRADGSRFPVEFRSTPIRTGDGRAGGAVIVFRDISTERRLAADLRERNERLRVITDSVPAFIAYVDSELRYQFNNALYERAFGLSPDELRGRPVREVLGENYARARDHLERALAGETIRIEQVLPVGDSRMVLDTSYVPDRRADGRVVGLHVLAVDVTEQRRSEELFRVLFEQSSDAHLIFDDTGIIECNNATVRMLRAKDKEDVLSRHPAEFSPEFQPDGRRSMEKSVEMDATAREHGYHRFDWMHTRFDGEDFACEVTLTPVVLSTGPALLVVWHDISERYAHEAEIERQRLETQLLLDHLPALVWYKDANNVILRVNGRAAEGLGLEVERIEGHATEEFYPDQAEAYHRDDLEVLASGEPKLGIVEPNVQLGEERLVRTDKIPLPDEHGEMTRVLVVSTDVTDLVQAERALVESERKFRGIFHQSFQFIGLMSPDGTVVDANRSSLDAAGVSPDDVIGRPFWETPWWSHSEELQRQLRDAVDRAAAGEFVRFEATHPRADGELIEVDFSLKPIEDDEGNVVFLIPEGRDVTALKRTERELRQRTDERDRFFNGAHDMLCIAGLDGYFTRVNPAFERTLGYTTEELLERPFIDFVHPEDVEETLAIVSQLGEGALVVDFRNRYRCKDGTYRWLSWSTPAPDENGRLFAAARDVTELLRAERELRLRTEELDRFFTVAVDLLCTLSLDGRFQRVNPAFERTLGFDLDEFMARPYLDFVHPDDLERTVDAIGRIAQGEEIGDFRIRCLHSDGTYRWISWTSSASDAVGHFYASGRDVTESIEYEERLAAQSAELARSNEDLNQFAYVASHDLRSPLRGISNLAEWIEEDSAEELSEQSTEHLRMLRQQCRRMDNLLNGLLEYSRAGRRRHRLERVDVGDVLAETVALLTVPADFRVEWADDAPVLHTERSPLERVFLNLIGNAIKHHDGSTGRVRVTWRPLGEMMEFTVEDDGPGIERRFHGPVFEMFKTLRRKDEVESSGMGLAIVQKLVEHHGGTIHIDPAEERGARFVFTWPIDRKPTADADSGA